ncbi:MAG: hypothetical protein V3R83_12430 [Gammaproteobacteria bacterium]
MVPIERIKQAQATTEEARKMGLERVIRPSIRSVFAQMVVEYVATLTATGLVPNAAVFQSEWEAIFLRHYRRVGRVFLPNQRRSKFYGVLTMTKQDLTTEENQTLILSFGTWSRGFGAQQSALVTQTNQSDYTGAFQRANEEVEDGSIAVVAAAAGVILRNLFSGRESAIANVQTQAPAEEAKSQEADALVEARRDTVGQQDKTWVTQRDERVRGAHVEADRQVRAQDEFFVVAGELLKYPGDTSQGASVQNIINCRCSALY